VPGDDVIEPRRAVRRIFRLQEGRGAEAGEEPPLPRHCAQGADDQHQPGGGERREYGVRHAGSGRRLVVHGAVAEPATTCAWFSAATSETPPMILPISVGSMKRPRKSSHEASPVVTR